MKTNDMIAQPLGAVATLFAPSEQKAARAGADFALEFAVEQVGEVAGEPTDILGPGPESLPELTVGESKSGINASETLFQGRPDPGSIAASTGGPPPWSDTEGAVVPGQSAWAKTPPPIGDRNANGDTTGGLVQVRFADEGAETRPVQVGAEPLTSPNLRAGESRPIEAPDLVDFDPPQQPVRRQVAAPIEALVADRSDPRPGQVPVQQRTPVLPVPEVVAQPVVTADKIEDKTASAYAEPARAVIRADRPADVPTSNVFARGTDRDVQARGATAPLPIDVPIRSNSNGFRAMPDQAVSPQPRERPDVRGQSANRPTGALGPPASRPPERPVPQPSDRVLSTPAIDRAPPLQAFFDATKQDNRSGNEPSAPRLTPPEAPVTAPIRGPVLVTANNNPVPAPRSPVPEGQETPRTIESGVGPEKRASVPAMAPPPAPDLSRFSAPVPQTPFVEISNASPSIGPEPSQDIPGLTRFEREPEVARPEPTRVAPEVSQRAVETARSVQSQLLDAARQTSDGTIEVRLSPEELGRVRMTVSQVDTGVTISVLVERGETLDLMRRHADLLSSELRDAGFEQLSFSFDQGSEGRGFREALTQTDDFDPDAEGKQNDTAPKAHAPLALGSGPARLDIRL